MALLGIHKESIVRVEVKSRSLILQLSNKTIISLSSRFQFLNCIPNLQLMVNGDGIVTILFIYEHAYFYKNMNVSASVAETFIPTKTSSREHVLTIL